MSELSAISREALTKCVGHEKIADWLIELSNGIDNEEVGIF